MNLCVRNTRWGTVRGHQARGSRSPETRPQRSEEQSCPPTQTAACLKEPLGGCLGRKEGQDGGSLRLGLLGEEWSPRTPAGTTAAGVGPGQSVTAGVHVCACVRLHVRMCAEGRELQPHCFQGDKRSLPNQQVRREELCFFSFLLCKNEVPVPPTPSPGVEERRAPR